MGVIVVVIVFDAYSRPDGRRGVGKKKVRMNLPSVSVVAIRSGMDVLKRRNEESQQECQACFDSYRATHHPKSTRRRLGGPGRGGHSAVCDRLMTICFQLLPMSRMSGDRV